MANGERLIESTNVAEEPIRDVAELDHPQEECGVFAIWRPGSSEKDIPAGTEILQDAYLLATRLQHRGRSAAGVAYVDTEARNVLEDNEGAGPYFVVEKNVGEVPAALKEIATDTLEKRRAVARLEDAARSPIVIGQTRYSTSSEDKREWAQPFLGQKSNIVVAHNGNIEGMRDIARKLGVTAPEDATDSAMLTMVFDIRVAAHDGDVMAAASELLPYIPGSYCLTITDGTRMYAMRDPWGSHPLMLAKEANDRGYMAASESVAFDGFELESIRDIAPGELVMIDEDGEHSMLLDSDIEPRSCMYEHIYMADPRSIIDGVVIAEARRNMGRALATSHPVTGDDVIVIGVPSSGLLAAEGYAEALEVQLDRVALTKNKGAGRTFILRGDARERALRAKFSVDPERVDGKKVVVVDDSKIKGNTQRVLAQMFREAGAAEVHALSAAPRYAYACPMGMDTHNVDELIARGRTDEQIAKLLQVDGVAFNTVSAIQNSIETARLENSQLRKFGQVCKTCFDGEVITDQARQLSEHVPIMLGMPALRGVMSGV